MRTTGFIIVGLFFLSFTGCSKEPEEQVRAKFDRILVDDLAAIVEGLDSTTLLDKPYFKELEWEYYEEGILSYRAVVEFYFYRTLPKKIVRKYRYNRSARKWERYYNEYMSVSGHLPQTDIVPVAEPLKKSVE